ncbi:MAG: SPOR domain-containing protein [Bacteroidetes bacterium]|nr:SPOR domain-containing protein [Bacteroidota bacterium]
MKCFLLIFFLAILLPFAVNGQTASDSLQKGVDIDPKSKVVVDKQIEINSKSKEKGYRVQIYFGADKAKANEEKAKFLGQYDKDIHAYEIYEAPNFKIRVGDFRTKLEAYAFLKKIKNEFPSAFIVESDIEEEGQ